MFLKTKIYPKSKEAEKYPDFLGISRCSKNNDGYYRWQMATTTKISKYMLKEYCFHSRLYFPVHVSLNYSFFAFM